MTDGELIARFEGGTLDTAVFRHRDHVQLACAYLARHGRAGGERRLAAGLQRLAAAAGRPEKFDLLLTRAWLDVLEHARSSTGAVSFEALVRARPDLLDPAAVRAGVGE